MVPQDETGWFEPVSSSHPSAFLLRRLHGGLPHSFPAEWPSSTHQPSPGGSAQTDPAMPTPEAARSMTASATAPVDTSTAWGEPPAFRPAGLGRRLENTPGRACGSRGAGGLRWNRAADQESTRFW